MQEWWESAEWLVCVWCKQMLCSVMCLIGRNALFCCVWTSVSVSADVSSVCQKFSASSLHTALNQSTSTALPLCSVCVMHICALLCGVLCALSLCSHACVLVSVSTAAREPHRWSVWVHWMSTRVVRKGSSEGRSNGYWATHSSLQHRDIQTRTAVHIYLSCAW